MVHNSPGCRRGGQNVAELVTGFIPLDRQTDHAGQGSVATSIAPS